MKKFFDHFHRDLKVCKPRSSFFIKFCLIEVVRRMSLLSKWRNQVDDRLPCHSIRISFIIVINQVDVAPDYRRALSSVWFIHIMIFVITEFCFSPLDRIVYQKLKRYHVKSERINRQRVSRSDYLYNSCSTGYKPRTDDVKDAEILSASQNLSAMI